MEYHDKMQKLHYEVLNAIAATFDPFSEQKSRELGVELPTVVANCGIALIRAGVALASLLPTDHPLVEDIYSAAAAEACALHGTSLIDPTTGETYELEDDDE